MAKTKEEGTEEFATLDDAFHPEEVETVEEVVEEVAEPAPEPEEAAQETTEVEPEEGEPEKAVETAEPEDDTEDSWAKYGLDKFDKMSREEIADYVHWRNRVDGRQSQELGELRKKVKDVTEPATKQDKVDFLDSIPDLTSTQVEDFNAIYAVNPVKAMMKYGKDNMKSIMKEVLSDSLPEQLKEVVGSTKDSIEYANFVSKHDDSQEHIPMMQILDGTEYLGGQARGYDELYNLSKMANSRDNLYQATYGNMKKYPNMTFIAAKKIASLEVRPKSAKTRAEIEKEVKKVDSVNPTAKKKRTSNAVGVHANIDEAFDSVED